MVEWVQESGDAAQDAIYVLSLPCVDMRQRELLRLARVHGDGYRWNVERAVKENWPETVKKLPPLAIEQHVNPREVAMQAVKAIGRRYACSLL